MPSKPKLAGILLGASMFFSGGSGLVAEYILATVSTYILGNSIEQMSITIAVAMLFMGIGGWAQKFLKDDYLIEKFIVLEIVLALLIAYSPLAIYGAFGLLESHFHVVQYFFISSIGFLIGFEIPLVTRINSRYSKILKVNLGNILSMDYFGSFAGALIWVYILLKWFPLTEISFLVASANFAVAVVTFLYFLNHKKVAKKKTIGLLIVGTCLILGAGYANNRKLNVALEQRLYDNPIIFAKTTKYQRLVMTKFGKLDEYRFYINGNLQFSSYDEEIYHEQLVHPAMSLVDNPRSALILGGGDGLALRELLKYPELESVTLVDLDPDMVRVCSTNPSIKELNQNAFQDARVITTYSEALTQGAARTIRQQTPNGDNARVAQVNVLNIDADRFLDDVQGFWDVIVIDFPDPNSIELTKLYSKEFYLKLSHRLSERGMIVIQSTSPYHAKESYLCVKRTMEAAGLTTIPYHDNVPSFGDWGWLLAWKANVPERAMRAKIASLESFPVETKYLTPEVFKSALIFGKGKLETQDKRINTLMHPILLDIYLRDSWLVD